MGDKGKLRSVPADPSMWSERSQLSLSAHYVKEYTDHQKHTFEVKKAPIDQRRTLCTECWRGLLEIDRDIKLCEQQWAESKKSLRLNADFLTKWLGLLVLREEFVPYRPDTAAQGMLRKLLDEANA